MSTENIPTVSKKEQNQEQKLVFVKKESIGEFGKNPEERTVDELIDYGIVNLDKPKGPTSHQVSDFVKKILKISKAGHSGTLDPQVTGVQPTGLSRATRITEFLLTAPKEYVCLMHLHKEISPETLKEAIEKFTGKIKQLPPIKSAVKRVERVREIYQITLLEVKGQDILFKMKCQAGTYVRKWCLHPQTKILTSEGSQSASDFFLYPSPIYSYSDGKIIGKKTSATQRIKSPKKLIKISVSSGISFIVTPDHEMLSSQKEGYKMIEARALKEGDYLVKSLIYPNTSKEYIISDLLDDNYLVQQEEIKEQCKQAFITKYGSIRKMYSHLKLDRKTFLSKAANAITLQHLKLAGIYDKIKKEIHTFKTQKGNLITLKKLNEDFFYLLGLIASDGNNTKEKKTERHTRIKFHNNEEALIDIFVKKHSQLFPSISISKRKMTAKLWQLDTSNSFLATIAASLGVKSPQKNSSLSPLVDLKDNFLRHFLRGYFDGDGSVYFNEATPKHKSKICIHTISHTDAINLHKMLLKIGIQNKIFKRIKYTPQQKKKCYLFDVTIEHIAAEKKFAVDIGTNNPKKAAKFKQILNLNYKHKPDDHLYIALHYKDEIRKNRSKLHIIGGNLSRILRTDAPITRAFYKRASGIVNLPGLDNFIIEKISSIEVVPGTDFVYDLTVPETHNFLIETGFVSSNCHDFGQEVKVGAHMAELRRTQAGPFTEDDNLVTLNNLQDAYHFYKTENNPKMLQHYLQPIETALKYIPKCWVLDSAITSLLHGRDLSIPGISKLENFKKNETVAIMTLKDELVAIGKAEMSAVEINCKEKGVAVNVNKVFMAERKK